MSRASVWEKPRLTGIEKMRFLYLSRRAIHASSSPLRQLTTRLLSDRRLVDLSVDCSGFDTFTTRSSVPCKATAERNQPVRALVSYEWRADRQSRYPRLRE